jgi:hypothetical protein
MLRRLIPPSLGSFPADLQAKPRFENTCLRRLSGHLLNVVNRTV